MPVDSLSTWQEITKKEVKHILKVFKQVYKNEDFTKKQQMTDFQRLEYHVTNNKPLLDDLKQWFKNETEIEKNIELNSNLGGTITYMTEHWDKLTLF